MTINLFILSVLLLDKCLSFASENADGPRIGSSPPHLTLASTVQGPPAAEISWDKLRGRVVVLEFWNTRCGPCITAIPHLNELVGQFSNQPVAFISITDDNPDHAKDFLKKKPMKGWIAIDGPLTATRSAFGVEGIPHTVVVDKMGKVAAITHPSQLKAEHLNEVLAGKLCSLPVPKPVSRIDDDETVPVSTPTLRIVEISISGPFPQPEGAFNFISWDESHTKFTAEKAYLKRALAAYFNLDENFVISSPNLPDGLYDIAICSPSNRVSAIQSQFISAFQTAFGFNIKTNSREMEVYAMKFSKNAGPNLKPAQKSQGGGGEQPGGFRLRMSQMDEVATFLGYALGKPVINEIQSTNLWAADVKWEMSPAELLPRRIYDQAGGELGNKLCDDYALTPPTPETLQAAQAKLSPEDFKVLQTELRRR